MTPEQWQRIGQLFHEAAELEPDKRAAFLKHACGNDATLQKEVESLLPYSEKSMTPLQSPVIGVMGEVIGEPPHQSIVGQTLDHYKILSPLGAGGMGEVYLAEDVRLNRKVAIKLLPAALLANSEQVRRLQQEARAASALNDPNIITIYELGQADSQPFIAMEFVEGETLRQKSAGLKFREALDIAIQTVSGLSAAHQAGIIHRDIKPENIMISRQGDVKILDFGIAKFKEQQAFLAASATAGALTGKTQASAVWGTVSYMSPEQARGERLDLRTDIFSLGIVLFEMITGRRPFAGETQAGTLQAILNDEVPALKDFRPDAPAGLQKIIDKALKKNCDERYQTAREMLADLREAAEEADTTTDTTERANRMLRQYLSIYTVDKRTLIPINKLRFIRRYADWRRSERGRELWQKSLRYGLLRLSVFVFSLLVLAAGVSTALSRSETWDVAILKDGHTRAVRQAAFSPDGKLLVSVGEDNRVIVWDFNRRMPLATFTDHTDWGKRWD